MSDESMQDALLRVGETIVAGIRMKDVPSNRLEFLEAIARLPEEAFGWIVAASVRPQNFFQSQTFPDGLGGFRNDSRKGIEQVAQAAEHYFQSEKQSDPPEKEPTITIIVNGRDLQAKGQKKVTYLDVVMMAFEQLTSKDVVYSITYTTRREGDTQRQGILSPNDEKAIELEDGMVFNVANTSNA